MFKITPECGFDTSGEMHPAVFDLEVEMFDDVLIIKAEQAKKLLDPARIARLVVRPDEPVVLKMDKQAAFSCLSVDQYGQPFAVAQVKWSATGDEPVPVAPPRPGEQIIRWRGTVPTQMWMNFYTKVLTRFAAAPGLKLEVSFEVPMPREQAQGKIDETRAGLKELGLDDNVSGG